MAKKLREKTIKEILELQKKYPEKRSALLPALHLAQEAIGYLPTEIQEEIAALFEINVTEVNGVVTFYDMFFDQPVGEKIVHVCKNVSCMLRGSDQLMEALSTKLNCSFGKTTADGKYTLMASECLGACDKAPMLLLGEEVKGPLKIDDLDVLFPKELSEKRGS